MKYEKIHIRMYGDYSCSCGCGKPLGNPTVYYTDDDICIAVSEEQDDEGFEWRTFRPECWKRLNLDTFSLEEIYNKYPAAPAVE